MASENCSYKLRRSAICRLLFTSILFLCYGGCSFYFNAYVHNLNDEAVTMFFVVSKRSVCTAAVSVFVKEALLTGDKRLVSSNPG